MKKRLAPICLVWLAVLLSGCGGGDTTPTLFTGDYFPLTVGRVWTYDTEIEVETPWRLFATTGTLTRTLTGVVPITLDGVTVNAYEFAQTTTVDTVPTGADLGPVGQPVVQAANTLFSPGYGFQPVLAYYTEGPGPAPAGTRQIILVATAENGGPITPVAPGRPLLLNPPQDGYGATGSHCFLPLPLMPPTRTLSEYQQRSKVLGYVIGSLPPGALEMYSFSAKLTLGGITGEFGGRGRMMLVKDVGVGIAGGTETDWTGTFHVADAWVRFTTRVMPH